MSAVVYLLDSEGLSQTVLGNRVMGARFKEVRIRHAAGGRSCVFLTDSPTAGGAVR
jgi:hypothetical protein